MASSTSEKSSVVKDHESEPELEKQYDSTEVVAAGNSLVWWKMDLIVLPLATMFFFLSFLVSGQFGPFSVQFAHKSLSLRLGSFQHR